MKSCVVGMSVREERKVLSELREQGEDVSLNFILSNGMKAGDFALHYVIGHHKKRQDKHRKKHLVNPCTGKDPQSTSAWGDIKIS
jgi:hypothetical protein